MPRHDAAISLQQMLDHAREACDLARGRDRTDLEEDRLLQLGLRKLIEIIGEAANRVPREFQARHPELPWSDIIGMRHRLIHGYDQINLDVLWATVDSELPILIRQLEAIVEP